MVGRMENFFFFKFEFALKELDFIENIIPVVFYKVKIKIKLFICFRTMFKLNSPSSQIFLKNIYY